MFKLFANDLSIHIIKNQIVININTLKFSIMKQLFLILIALTGLACKGREDNSCNCSQQKYQRTVIKDIATQSTVFTSDWQASGAVAPVGSDCDTNGLITSSGSENSHPIGGGQYVVTDFKYQIKCN